MIEKVTKKSRPINIDKKIETIMECFDFDQVKTVMNFDKVCRDYDDEGNVISEKPWYIHSKGYLIRPNINELKEIALYLFKSLKQHLEKYPRTDFFQTSTGPFEVTYYKGMVKLNFVVESWYEED